MARVLQYLGIVGVVLLFSKVHALAIGYDWSQSFRFAWSIAYMGVLGVVSFGLGLPDQRTGRWGPYRAAVQATAFSALGISVIQLAVGDALLPRSVILGSALALVPWLVGCARLAEQAVPWQNRRVRVILVAPDDEALEATNELARSPEMRATVVATVAPADVSRIAAAAGPLLDLVRSQQADLVVLCRDAQADESVVAQAALLHEQGVRVRTLSMFYEQWLGKLPVSELERVSLLFDIREVHRIAYGRLRRLSDLMLAAAGGVVLLAVTPGVMVANRVANRGPLLYRQDRVGKHGEVFEILKFRTMTPPAGAHHDAVGVATGSSHAWTSTDDARVTKFGRFLRTSHLDELPQVINILRGELATVGPRPEQPAYVEELTTKLPFYGVRHLVRPGLTGWAQVKYGYAGDERDALEKLQYEFFYLRHQGTGLDARILGRTLRTVLGRQGR